MWGRMIIFATVLSTVFLSANALVCATWSHFFGVTGWGFWQAIPGAIIVSFIGTTILGFRYSNPLLRAVYTLSATWLAVLNFAFFASVACWFVDGVARLAGWPLPRFEVAAVLFGIALLTTIYGLVNAAWVRVTRVTVPLPNLPAAWEGRAVALVTDLHLGHLSGPAFVRRILSRLRTLQPEAVLISGDMFDGDAPRPGSSGGSVGAVFPAPGNLLCHRQSRRIRRAAHLSRCGQTHRHPRAGQ